MGKRAKLNRGPSTPGADKLREAIRPKMRIAELMKRLGVTQQAINSWVNRRTRPNAQLRILIERVLGIPVEDWMNADERARAKKAA